MKTTGWNLFSAFSDRNPGLSKTEFTRQFERRYRCKIFKDFNQDTYYMEFQPKDWIWLCLQFPVDSFDIIE